MDVALNQQTAGSFIFFLLLLAFTIWIAHRGGFFRLPPPTSRPPVTWIHIAGALFLYLVVAALIVPLLFTLTVFAVTGIHSKNLLEHLSPLWKGWGQFGGLFFLFLMLSLYCFRLAPQTRHFIFWGDGEASRERFATSLGMGFVCWVVSYPFVLVSSLITSAIATWLWGESQLEQVAVKQLKMTMGNTPLFLSMIVMVVVLVPCMEEFLFRGLLQNFLKRYLNRAVSIALTAVIFACVHFAKSQGTANFQLILSLLALSGFLGFIYERERTLWAPIFLHMTFNGINILVITLAK